MFCILLRAPLSFLVHFCAAAAPLIASSRGCILHSTPGAGSRKTVEALRSFSAGSFQCFAFARLGCALNLGLHRPSDVSLLDQAAAHMCHAFCNPDTS